MRYLMRLFHKKGFTLTELIIVIAIVGILMLSLVTFSAPVRLMVKGTDAKAECLTINNTVGNYLEHTLAYADDIRIYAGVDLATALTTINTAYSSVQSSRPSTANNRSGMIVFHYVAHDDKFKSGYRVYELLSKDTDGKQLSLTSRTVDGSTVYDISDSKSLYFEDFYGSYSFFLEADSNISHNSARNKDYLKLFMRSYYFDGSYTNSDGSDMYFRPGDATTHYQHVADVNNGVEESSVTEDKLTKYLDASSGQEDIFFALENSGVDGAHYEYNLGYTDDAGGVHYGDDVVIIYNIKKYTYSS